MLAQSRLRPAAAVAIAALVAALGLVAATPAPAGAAQQGDFTYEIAGGIATITAYTGSATTLGIPTTLGGAPVRVIGPGAFEGQTQLYDIAIGNVTTIGPNAFRNSGLTTLSLTNAVQDIGVGAFQDSKLTSVTLGSAVRTVGAEAFRGNLIATLNIFNGLTTVGDNAFRTNWLTSVTLPNSVTSIGSHSFSFNRISSLSIGSGLASVADNAFANNLLTSLTIPNTVTSIGSSAFYSNVLKSLNLGNGVATIGYLAFASNALTSVIIPNSVTTIQGYAFHNNLLTGINLGPGPTSIGIGAFANNELASVVIPGNVTTIHSYAFQYNKLTSISLGNGVTNIEAEAFSFNLLTAVTIPSSVTTIGAYAFADNSLSSVTFHGDAPATGLGSFSGFGPPPTVHYDPATTGWSNPWNGLPAVGDVNLYTINYALGGAADPGNPATFHRATPTFTLINPTRPGYDFAGWTGTGLDVPTQTVTIPVGSTGFRSYTATWSLATYTMSYSLGRGDVSGNPETYTIESADITLNNPTREGYTFLGWTGTDLDEPTQTVTIPQGSTGNRSYTATWELTEYELSYDLAGGSDPSNPASYTIATPDLTLKTPTREGYTFEGWTGTDVEKPATTVTIPAGSTGDRSYTATWSLDSYTIAYSLGGAVNPGNPTSYTAESAAFTLTSPSRTGYTFAGWTGTGLAGPTPTVTVPSGSTGNRTYTATWAAVPYAISYELDGGAVVGNPTVYTADFPAMTLINPTRAGFVFAGWTGTDLAGPTLAVTIPSGSSGNRTYTATWTEAPFSIDYNLGGGAGPDNPAVYGADTPTFTLVNPARAGYTFAGWTGTDLATPTHEVTIPQGSAGDRSYTATWTPVTYTVTYTLGGGAASGNPVSFTAATATFALKAPTRTGYTFAGWTGTGLSKATKAVTIPAGSSGNRSYTATWTPVAYSLKYALGGGKASGNPAQYTVTKAKFTLKAPTRAGYTFAGWTGTGLSKATKAVSIATGSTGNRTYTATWTPVKYTLKYTLGGGKASGNPASYTVTKATFTLKAPKRTGYTFTGWTGTGLKKATKAVSIAKGSTGNRSYKATWKANAYKVKFNANKGTGKAPTAQPLTYGKAKALKANAFKRSGYTFLGWSTSKTAKTAKYKNKASIKNLTTTNGKTITLYAIWRKK